MCVGLFVKLGTICFYLEQMLLILLTKNILTLVVQTPVFKGLSLCVLLGQPTCCWTGAAQK